MSIGMIIQSYAVIASANGYVMGKSPTAPSPYAVWQVDHDGEGVCCGHYFVDREEAEWDFCVRAFEWFEDNMYIHMIEDEEEHSETHCVFDPPTKTDSHSALDAIFAARAAINEAAGYVDGMCEELDRLKEEGRRINVNSNKD